MTTPLSAKLLAHAKAQGKTVTCAESCTGGMVAAAITEIAGSSAIFERGFVTYSNTAKTEMLGVSPDTLAACGAVSEEVARAMACGALKAAKADIAVAISGIAGPGPSEHKPEGRVCFGLATAQGSQSETLEFGALGRATVRQKAKDHALSLLLNALTP